MAHQTVGTRGGRQSRARGRTQAARWTSVGQYGYQRSLFGDRGGDLMDYGWTEWMISTIRPAAKRSRSSFFDPIFPPNPFAP